MPLRLMPMSLPKARRAQLITSLVLLMSTTAIAAPALAQTAGQQSSGLPGSKADGVNPADTPKVTPGVKPPPAPTAEDVNRAARQTTPAPAAPAPAAAQAATAAVVRHITVQGNERI